MNNVLMVIFLLGLGTMLTGGIFLAIRLANVLSGEKRGHVKKYLALPIALLVIGFIVFAVTFYIAAPNSYFKTKNSIKRWSFLFGINI